MKRGSSGLSLVVGVDKPQGMSSHDVVNRCRRIFGEKRVGHTGTLDPAASGVLPICIGPATRLGNYLTAHDKYYVATVVFGIATDTDDAEGKAIKVSEPTGQLLDESFARRFVSSLVGKHKQIPPAYSAIKVAGKKACDEARRGNIIDLAPRDIEVFSAELVAVRETECGFAEVTGIHQVIEWDIAFHVSKGTYIRSLARDIGRDLSCPAHLGALRRTKAGNLTIDACVSLETLESLGVKAALDPVSLLGLRFAFISDELAVRVSNGNTLAADSLKLFDRYGNNGGVEPCECTSGIYESKEPAFAEERISVVANNKLIAIYEFDDSDRVFKPCCVFQTGVSRGNYL